MAVNPKARFQIVAEDRTAVALKSAMTRMERFSRQARSVLGAAAGAIATGFLARHLRQTVQSADAMLNLTQRIGGTVESLSELEHVASMSGLSFNTMTMGLQRMTRRIAEAARGTGEAKGALKELGLDALALSRLPLDQQFEVIADRLSGVRNESDRVRLAMKLFDSEGVALLQTMQRGSAGIRDLREEARRLGKTLTTEQAEAAARAEDSLQRLSTTVGSLSRNLTLALAPALADAVEGLNNLLFPSEMVQLQDQLDQARKRIKQLKSGVETVMVGPGRSIRIPVGVDEEELRKAEDNLLSIVKRMSELRNRQANEAGGVLIPIAFDAEANRKRFEDALEAMHKEGQKRIQSLWQTFFNRYATAEQRVADEMRQFDVVRHLFPPEEQDRIEQAIRSSLMDGLEAIDLDEIHARQRRLSRERAEDLKRALDDAKEGAREFAFTMSSAFEDAVFRAGKLRDIVRGLVIDLARIFFRRKFTNPIMGALTEALPGFQHGGSFTVGGSGGPDSQLVAFRATPGEQVTVSNGRGGGPAAVPPLVQHFHFPLAVPSQLEADIRNIAASAGRAAALQVAQAQRGRI